MVPGVCHYSLRAYTPADSHGKPVCPLLEQYACYGCCQSYPTWGAEHLAHCGKACVVDAVVAYHGTYHQQRHTYYGCRKCLVFAMSVVMIFVLGLVAYAHEYQYYDVGGEVG